MVNGDRLGNKPPSRPTLFALLIQAFRIGLAAAWHNRNAMLLIQSAIALIVIGYYFIPSVQDVLAVVGHWQEIGGIGFAALTNSFSGGILSEFAIVYALHAGQWTSAHRHNLIFKLILFSITGSIAYEFYHYQAVWFGTGHDWGTIVKKVAVDQFIFSVFWATPFQLLTMQWKHQAYSFTRLWSILTPDFVIKTYLSIMASTWLFWLPTISLVYCMPLVLQMPLAVFATAIWAILMVAVQEPKTETSYTASPLLIPTSEN